MMSETIPSGTNFESGSTLNDNDTSVEVRESVGTLFLGIIAMLLLLALLRSQRRTMQLLEKQLEETKTTQRKESKK